MKSSVYPGKLMHNRLKPRKHRFCYRVASWLFDLDELEVLDKNHRLFSLNRFNLIAFHEKDYGDSSGKNLKKQIAALLNKENLPEPDQVSLLCFPRILGYVFNPLSVYYCHKNNALFAIVYEVSNTFGERHSYVIPAQSSSEAAPIIRQTTHKKLHVSPFFPMDCYYLFRTAPPDEKAQLAISLNDQDGKLFAAVFAGTRQTISDRFILKLAAALPFQTVKVIAAIHWEALRIWLKGIKLYRHVPAAKRFSWSRGKLLRTSHSNREYS